MIEALGNGQVGAMAPPCPVQPRVPADALARYQVGRLVGAVAEKIVLGKAHHRIRDFLTPCGDPVDHRVGQAQQRHGGGNDRIALPAPFRGNGGGQLFGGQGERVAGGGLDRAAVQQHGEAACHRRRRNLFVETLHLFFFFGGKGSRLSSGSKPRSRQLCSMWGGRRAVTCSRPPSGRPISIERACRCSLSGMAPFPLASAPPYLKSPTIGVPRLARWTRIWWVRPVIGRAAT